MGAPEAARAAPVPVRASGLIRRYGSLRALDGVDLTLQHGEFLTLLGPNGAGKSTLLRVVASLVRPTAGAVSLFGLDPRSDPDAARRRLGFLSHSGFLYAGLSVRENLGFFARLYDLPDAEARVDASLQAVGLAGRADDPVRALSRGLQQRAAIARAFLHDPELVLLDEPFTGLDQHAGRLLRSTLEQFRSRGRSVIMVTHHIEEALGLSTRVAILVRGRIVWDSPASSLTRDLLARTYAQVVEAAA